jgi:hypothetical protein
MHQRTSALLCTEHLPAALHCQRQAQLPAVLCLQWLGAQVSRQVHALLRGDHLLAAALQSPHQALLPTEVSLRLVQPYQQAPASLRPDQSLHAALRCQCPVHVHVLRCL